MDVLLQKYEGVIGRSAGALALGKKGVVTERYSRITRLAEGLSIVDLCVKTHYTPINNATLRRLSKQTRIYAVPEAAALVCNKGALSSYIGDMCMFEDGEKQFLNR